MNKTVAAALILAFGFPCDIRAAKWVLVYTESDFNSYYDYEGIEYRAGSIIETRGGSAKPTIDAGNNVLVEPHSLPHAVLKEFIFSNFQ